MKYCTKCGAELFDDAVLCMKCGCAVESDAVEKKPAVVKCKGTGLRTAAMVLMIVSVSIAVVGLILAVALARSGLGVAFLPVGVLFAWQFPMLVYLMIKRKNNESIGVAFKVCTLIFVSVPAGIFLLCDSNEGRW